MKLIVGGRERRRRLCMGRERRRRLCSYGEGEEEEVVCSTTIEATVRQTIRCGEFTTG